MRPLLVALSIVAYVWVSSVKAAPTDVGCADGEREGFVDQAAYPDIAGCSGGWSVPGIHTKNPGTAPACGIATYDTLTPACGRGAGDDSPNPGGSGCDVADLCAAGWHVCASASEVAADSPSGCGGVTLAGDPPMFFATRQTSTGCGFCAMGTGTGSDCNSSSCKSGCAQTDNISNDIFGCGNFGGGLAASTCGPLDRSSHDQCSELDGSIWSCPNSYCEAFTVTKSAPSYGGVLCCRDSAGRYIDNGDGTISDQQTGLQWEKKSTTAGSGENYADAHDVDNTYTWTTTGTVPDGTVFTDFLAKLNDVAGQGAHCFAGHCDWRLPESAGSLPQAPSGKPAELESILTSPPCDVEPCIDPIFGPTIRGWYWSGTSLDAPASDTAWTVAFFNKVDSGGKEAQEYVRAVRTWRTGYVAIGDSTTTGFSVPTCQVDRYASAFGCVGDPPAIPYPNRIAATAGFQATQFKRVGIWGYKIHEAVAAADTGHNEEGPWTPQLLAAQLANLLVTVSFGANDIDFRDIGYWLQRCLVAQQVDADACTKAAGERAEAIRPDVEAMMNRLDVAKANGARIVVVLYYNPYNDRKDLGPFGVLSRDCGTLYWMSEVIVGHLNLVLAGEAARHGFTTIDLRPAFRGHGAGSSDSYVFGTDCDVAGALGAVEATFDLGWPPAVQINTDATAAEIERRFDPHPNNSGTTAQANEILKVVQQ